MAQAYEAYEIIVVDDGSTDNTEEVVRGIANSRLRYFKKPNAERGAARNYGAQQATGRYVNFFDSDDLAYPNHLREASKAIEALHEPEIFHLGYEIRNAKGKLERRVNTLPSPVNDALADGNHLSCNCVFVRRDIFLDLPFSENRALSASEDYALWLRMAARYAFSMVCGVVTSTLVNHDARSVVMIKTGYFSCPYGRPCAGMLSRINSCRKGMAKALEYVLCLPRYLYSASPGYGEISERRSALYIYGTRSSCVHRLFFHIGSPRR